MTVLSEITRYIAGITAVVAGTPRTAASVNAGLTDLANRTKWLYDRLYVPLLGTPKLVESVDTGGDTLTITGHSIPSNTAVQVFATNGGTLPGGVSASTPYWVGVDTANTIKLYAAAGPATLIDLTAGYVGDVYVQAIPDWFTTLLLANGTYGTGQLGNLIMWLAGTQTVTGAKTFDNITVSAGNQYKVSSRSVTRAIPVTWVSSTDNKAYTSSMQPSVPAGEVWWADFELPHNQTLTNLTITINPDNVGVLPGNLPQFDGSAFDVTTGAPAGAGFGPIDDPSADVAAYNPIHDISSGTLTEALVGTARIYSVSFNNRTADPITICGLRGTVTATTKTNWS